MRGISNKPTSLDFFAGSGLATEGLKKFFDTIWANDNSIKKAQVFQANHGSGVFHSGPIEQVVGKEVPNALLSWGSFPCQDLSLAGNMGGLSKSRSGLFWQWLRVMDELREKPPLVVAENVVGLVSAAGGENYRTLHNALVERGYKVGAVILDAAQWLPQSRKRVFVIAIDEHIQASNLELGGPTWCHPSTIIRVANDLRNWVWWNLPPPRASRVDLDEVINFGIPCDESEKRRQLLNLLPPKHREKMRIATRNGRSVFPGYRRVRNGKQVLELRFDGIAGCLRTPEGGSSRQFLVIKENGFVNTRLLAVEEAAALMGAPKGYQIPGSYNDGYRAMGDAVAVPVVQYLAEKLLKPIADIILEAK